MSYTVFVQKFTGGEPCAAPYASVASMLEKYGDVTDAGGRLEFRPTRNDLCEMGFIGGNKAGGINSIAFERPVSGGSLALLVFDLLGIHGMCYFELDCNYVLARTEITAELPARLIGLCESGTVTIASSENDVPL